MYDKLGVNVQSHSCARCLPNNGIEKTTGKKYAVSFMPVSATKLHPLTMATHRHDTGSSKTIDERGPPFLRFGHYMIGFFKQASLLSHMRSGQRFGGNFIVFEFSIAATSRDSGIWRR